MTITKLRQLIALATNGEITQESHAAALQACRYINTHGVELKLPSDTEAPKPPKQFGWTELTHDGHSSTVCDGCDEPIETGERYWFKRGESSKGPHQRLHGGCV